MTKSPTSALPRWRTVGDGLCRVDWPLDSSLFNPETGETHLLSALPAEVLSRLAGRPSTFAYLCERLADDCEATDDGAWRNRIETILDQLAALELIELA